MRVVIAPDKFAGTVTAAQAAAALARGWDSRRAGDELRQLPMSDGGPGFLSVLAAALVASDAREVTTTDPLGRPISAAWLLDQETAYVESAQVVGLQLLADGERDPERTTSAGLAALLEAALDAGARRIVVGLGGSATNDGGRGLIATLTSRGSLTGIRAVDLVIATDVDNPLLGLSGASAVFGPQKGADREAVARLEGRMRAWVAELDGLDAVAGQPGAGAAGGLGAALLWLGGRREPGAALIADADRPRSSAAGRRPRRDRRGRVRHHVPAGEGGGRGGGGSGPGSVAVRRRGRSGERGPAGGGRSRGGRDARARGPGRFGGRGDRDARRLAGSRRSHAGVPLGRVTKRNRYWAAGNVWLAADVTYDEEVFERESTR